MCRLTPANEKIQSTTSPVKNNKKSSSFVLWPLPLWLVMVAIPLLLPSYYLNRGYTRWYHLCAFGYMLTQNESLCKFIAVQGLLINAGWYCTLLLDYFWNDRLLHILYRNMPEALGRYIISGENITGYNVTLLPSNTPSCVAAQLVSVGLDLTLHPLLCLYFWRRCRSVYGTRNWHDICSWKVLGAALILSRIWSLTHNWLHYYDNNTLMTGFYYFGPQVYKVAPSSEHLWMAAYVGEAITTVVLVAGKLRIAYQEARRPTSIKSLKVS